MHPDQRLRKSVKAFYAYLGSVLLGGIGPGAAMWLIHHESPAWRMAGVVVGVGAWMPLMLFTASIIRASDEFVQRIHLLAMSLAFAGALLLISVLDWLVRAEFIEPVPYMAIWLSIALLWAIALFVAKRRFERGPDRP